MDMTEYQYLAQTSDQYRDKTWSKDGAKNEPSKHNVIPLLGLVGEVGGLVSEYKKLLRDGAIHELFPDQVAEELGDILWYVATVATKFDLDLDKIAKDNIEKAQNRWHEPGKKRPLYDAHLSSEQQLPRIFSYTFAHVEMKGEPRLVMTDNNTGETLGDPLKNNAYEDDGYRYHDVLHLAFAAHLGWSPVWRKLLSKRATAPILKRTPAEVDDAEDGGRPQVIEEGIVHAAYVYADQHKFLDGVKAVDWHLLRHIQQMTAKLEVRNRSGWEWNHAIIDGFRVWRLLIKHGGGIVEGDLVNNSLRFTAPKK